MATYQISKEVTSLSHPQLVLVAESRYEVDVGLYPRRVCLQANVDEAGQEVVCAGRRLVRKLQQNQK